MRKFYAELKTSQKTDLPQSALIYTYSNWYTKLLLWRVTSNLQRPKKWIFLLFDGNRLWWGWFCLHCALYKIHTWKLFAHGKIKSRRKSLVGKKKMKKKFWTKEERKKERVPFCQEKKKNSSWQRPVLAKLCAGVQVFNIEVAVKPKFTTHNVKKEVSFSLYKYQPYAKTLKVASNCNFESCLSIRCLAPLHILSFFAFLLRVLPLPFLTLLIIVSSSSMLHWAIEIKKNMSAMGYFSREILIHRHWRQEVPLSY